MDMIKKPYLLAAVLFAVGIAVYAFYRPTQQPGSGPAMVNVTVPELTETAKQGQQLFNANCALCHGRNAAGQNGVAPPLVHKFYEPNHHGDISFHRAAKFGVRAHHWRFGNMPPVKGVNDADVDKIVAYVRELQRANGIH